MVVRQARNSKQLDIAQGSERSLINVVEVSSYTHVDRETYDVTPLEDSGFSEADTSCGLTTSRWLSSYTNEFRSYCTVRVGGTQYSDLVLWAGCFTEWCGDINNSRIFTGMTHMGAFGVQSLMLRFSDWFMVEMEDGIGYNEFSLGALGGEEEYKKIRNTRVHRVNTSLETITENWTLLTALTVRSPASSVDSVDCTSVCIYSRVSGFIGIGIGGFCLKRTVRWSTTILWNEGVSGLWRDNDGYSGDLGETESVYFDYVQGVTLCTVVSW
ncbi:hypothetical protein Tco_0561009 [Tanacetum coccineum]